ncbi:phage tail protein [Nonomuraea terrae]|uniref:Phage tail protein n=1 Tax=Nonomuraea terrae TaxID=2530383 RepID=A0A4R4ZBN5_9ACTN|nr:phage tail protein [Nonomuraea terrae]TDD54589.1 phage tail protein [Nonomuraea terrae]
MVNIIRAADLALVGSNGGAWVAPLGTAQPTDPAGAPTGAWLAIGAISEDGLTNGVDEDSEQFTPWGLNSPFRTVVTSSVRTFSFTAWETNRPIVKSLQYRIPVEDLAPDEDGIITFAETATAAPDRRAWLFDVYDGTVWERFFIPEGEITERSEVTYAQGEMVGYEWTISTYPDSSNNLVYHSYLAPEVEEHMS